MSRFRMAAGIVALAICVLLLFQVQIKDQHLSAVGGKASNTRWTYEVHNRSDETAQLLLWSLKDGEIVDLSTHQIDGREWSINVVIQRFPGAVEVSCGAWKGSIQVPNENFYPGWTSSADLSPEDGGMQALWHGHSEEINGEWQESLTYHGDGLKAFRESSRRQPSVTLYGVCVSFDEPSLSTAMDTQTAGEKVQTETLNTASEL